MVGSRGEYRGTGFSRVEYNFLVQRFGLDASDAEVFVDALRVARAGRWRDTDTGRRQIEAFLSEFTKRHVLDPSIRFAGCELSASPFTAYIDITTTELRYRPVKATETHKKKSHDNCSGHKGVVVKYQVTTTAQGTPIDVRGPFAGRHHDFYYWTPPFPGYIDHDYVALDGGYQGVRHPGVVPFRRSRGGALTEDQQLFNVLHSRYRSRIERLFGTVKSVWRIVEKTLMDNFELHGKFVRLVFVCYGAFCHSENLKPARKEPKRARRPPLPRAAGDGERRRHPASPAPYTTAACI